MECCQQVEGCDPSLSHTLDEEGTGESLTGGTAERDETVQKEKRRQRDSSSVYT